MEFWVYIFMDDYIASRGVPVTYDLARSIPGDTEMGIPAQGASYEERF